MTKLSVDEANAFLSRTFEGSGTRPDVILMEPGRAIVCLAATSAHLRPGGYISGPTQMSLVDTAAYMAVMTLSGLEPMAVTSQLNIHFLRPCIGERVVAEARVLTFGKTSAVLEVEVRVDGAAKPSSKASVVYARARPQEAAA